MSRERRQIRRGRRAERQERRAERIENRAVRQRRTPEAAKQLLLDAAERLFADENPGDVGLKEVAREAGVSHALITHYFGTYAGLVEATLERRLATLRERIRERLGEAGALSRPEELLGMLFTALEDPVHLRLVKWLAASERATPMFALQHRGLQAIAQQVAHAVRPNPPREMLETLELALLTAVAAATGYAISKAALAGAIGQEPNPALDAGVRKTLAGMVQTYLRDRIGLA
ncbi:MAG TPA: helix-turn-helix domain-containing protein [Kofleriaceae bacterium]|nr:helix-turn-helix domain-containing protein [Kofleriaceae bacterium]